MAFVWQTSKFNSIFEDRLIPQIISVGMEDMEHRKMVRAMHVHDDRLELLLILKGSGIHTINGKQHHVQKGDILIHNCNSIHDECSNSDTGMNILSCALKNVHIKGLNSNCLVPDSKTPVIQSGKRFQELESLFAMMYDFTMQNNPHSTEVATYLTQALLVIIYDLIINQSPIADQDTQQLGQSIKDYIDAHYLEEISLQTIAESLHINQYYLSHIFKSVSGYSPMQYIIRRRIGEAQSYLLQTDKSITEIAMTVGYNNSNHFHNTFLKIVGMTPGKYRSYWNNKK